MLPTLDFTDMVKTGQATPRDWNIKDGPRKYAVIIKNAHTALGKFDITDKDSVEESVYALANNNDIPDIIRKSAEYYVKAAADYYNIDCDFAASPAPHEIVLSDIVVKTAEHVNVPMLSFGGRKFILSSEENIKEAEEFFLRKKYLYPAKQRINVSRIIVKAAALTQYTPGDVVKAYSSAQYGNSVKDVLYKKAALSSNEKYASAMKALCECYSSIPVDEFIDMIDTCDKVAEVRHNRYGIETHDILIDVPRSIADDIIKAAHKSDLLSDLSEDE